MCLELECCAHYKKIKVDGFLTGSEDLDILKCICAPLAKGFRMREVEKILSIIVPSYNMEAYLPKCLGSLVIGDKELLQKLDVIVVNDGSKDRTSEVAHEFEAKYPGVFRVIDKANGNYGSCINAALPVAEGIFVKVLDADDSFNVMGFIRFLKYLDGCDADLVISDYDVVDENGVVTEHRTYDFPTDKVFSFKEFGATSRYLSMHAYTYRIKVVQTAGYRQLEGVSYSDSEWVLLPLVGVKKITYSPETVYRYLRGRAGQTMEAKQIAKNFWMLARLALDMLRQFVNSKPAASQEAIEYLLPRLTSRVANVYRGGIFGSNGLRARIDLSKFDMELKTCHPDFYEYMNAEVYCHRIPYRYISGWRKKVLLQYPLILLCKAYSWIASRKALFR